MRFDAQARKNADMVNVCSRPNRNTQIEDGDPRGAFGRARRSSLLLFLAAFAMTGCASVATIEPNGSMVRHFIGYVKVAIPQAAARGAMYTSDVSVWGLRVSSGAQAGIGVGYSRDRQMVVPLDCRVAVLVANQAQLDDAITRLNHHINDGRLCAVVDPSNQTTPPGE